MIIGVKESIVLLLDNNGVIRSELDTGMDISCFKVSDSGLFLAVYTFYRTSNIVYIYKINKEEISLQIFNKIVLLDGEDAYDNFAISPNDKFLATICNSKIYVYYMQEELEKFPVIVLQNNDDEYTDILNFSSDSNVLATISESSGGGENTYTGYSTILFSLNNFEIFRTLHGKFIGFTSDKELLYRNNNNELNILNFYSNNIVLKISSKSIEPTYASKIFNKFLLSNDGRIFVLYYINFCIVFNLDTYQILDFKVMKYIIAAKYIENKILVLLMAEKVIKINLNTNIFDSVTSVPDIKNIYFEEDSIKLFDLL